MSLTLCIVVLVVFVISSLIPLDVAFAIALSVWFTFYFGATPDEDDASHYVEKRVVINDIKNAYVNFACQVKPCDQEFTKIVKEKGGYLASSAFIGGEMETRDSKEYLHSIYSSEREHVISQLIEHAERSNKALFGDNASQFNYNGFRTQVNKSLPEKWDDQFMGLRGVVALMLSLVFITVSRFAQRAPTETT